jgi:pyruvate/2-oxoglutarate dehydrogenase complex dihydrolipoamide acyltransferase (E2) component
VKVGTVIAVIGEGAKRPQCKAAAAAAAAQAPAAGQ